MNRLITFLIFLFSLQAFGMDLSKQRDILVQVEKRVRGLQEQIPEKSSGEQLLLQNFHKVLIDHGRFDPKKEKGGFVASFQARMDLQKQWKTLKRKLVAHHSEGGFRLYEQAVQRFLQMRRDGLYKASRRFVSGSIYRQSYNNLNRLLIDTEGASQFPLDRETLLVFRRDIEEQLNLLVPVSQTVPAPAMSLSSKVAPVTKEIPTKAALDSPSKVPQAQPRSHISSREEKVFGLVFLVLCSVLLGHLIYRTYRKDFIEKDEDNKPSEANLLRMKNRNTQTVSSLKVEAIHSLTRLDLQSRVFSRLEDISSMEKDYSSARNIVLNRLNTIVSDLSQLEEYDDAATRQCLKKHFVLLQAHVKAMKSVNKGSKVNSCIINAFREILEEMMEHGKNSNDRMVA